MSDSYKEDHPLLLCEEIEAEQFDYPHQRQFQPMLYRGRARNQARGAANIINKWPEYWTSSASRWWIGLGMITLTIFIIYNNLIALALLPTAHTSSIRLHTTNQIDIDLNPSNISPSLPEVFMHLLVNSNDEVDLNKYLPFIEIISNKYLQFKYNLIVVLNDSTNDADTYSAEENNEIALNSLWSKEHHLYEKSKANIYNNNINIKHMTLSNYMNESPLKKHWRHLPHQFIGFLMRAVSVWDKGGVSFDPNILTPFSPHPIYSERLELLLQKYHKCNEHNSTETKSKKHLNKQKVNMQTKVNNIQDIIDILEHNADSFNSSQYSPTEAESRNEQIFLSGRNLLSTEVKLTNSSKSNIDSSFNINILSTTALDKDTEKHNYTQNMKMGSKTYETQENTKHFNNQRENNNTSKLNLLPLFLEFLLRDRSKSNDQKPTTPDTPNNILQRHRNSVIPGNDHKINISGVSTVHKAKEYSPMIIAANGIENDDSEKIINVYEKPIKCENIDQLTIDLKGNILATRTPCHAFIGTLFSNIIRHTKEETLQDLIVAELSIFCKGLLSSCKGIDVILL